MIRIVFLALALGCAGVVHAQTQGSPDANTAQGSASAPGVVVSEKKDIAIFSLSYYGFDIPYSSLGSIDVEIQKVFVDIGRFNVIGMKQRLSASDLDEFIRTIKKAKQADFVAPERYQFGEAVLTEADFNKLSGAFIVGIPIVDHFNLYYDENNSAWKCSIRTAVTFIEPGSSGSTIGMARMYTFGESKDNRRKAMSDAIGMIPFQLQFQIRSIKAFQISTRVLKTAGSKLWIELGKNMGLKLGDEYAVMTQEDFGDIHNQSETGLVEISSVGSDVSTANVLYSDTTVTTSSQLVEIPRLGIDLDLFSHYIIGQSLQFKFAGDSADRLNVTAGFRGVLSRGFYTIRPLIFTQVPFAGVRNVLTASIVPIDAGFGAEYRINFGRLSIAPWCGVGASYIVFSEALSGTTFNTQDTYIPHVGGLAYLNIGGLITRDLRFYVDAGGEYWFSLAPSLYTGYGGLGLGAGLMIKF